MYCNGVTVLLGRVDRFAVHLMAESLKATKCVSHLCNVCKVSTSCATETGVTNVDALESLSRLLFDWWLQVICFTAGRFFGLTELTGRCLAFILRLRQFVIEACQVKSELKLAWDHLSRASRWDWVSRFRFLLPYFDPLLVALCSDKVFIITLHLSIGNRPDLSACLTVLHKYSWSLFFKLYIPSL